METKSLLASRKTLVLTDEKMGVKVFRANDGSWWVQFIGATKWGRKLYQPTALDLAITPESADVTRLVVQE